ncbi:MAG: ABC transporter substrate-binding protein [Phenylobacterium sp.]|nr:MAG: ABC transporter substrate-binding protein [Phenylobacterium sp.]
MRLLLLVAVLALGLPMAAGAATLVPRPTDVIVDEDGAVDDLFALSLLLKSDAVRVRAVTISPADSYLAPATLATQLILDRLGARGVSIAQGHSEGLNPFPAAWRRDHAGVLDVAALKGLRPSGRNPVVAEDAAHHLARLLSGPGTYTIVETGPLTNIADALRLKPAIRAHIRRIYVMGGAVRVKGNAEPPGADGSAEWNFYNQPRAAAAVLGSGVPITLVPLDASNRVPMTLGFADRLAARPSAAAQLTAQMLRPAIAEYPDEYYFWDPLTAAVLLDPGVATWKTLRLRVVTQGLSQGRTVEAADGAAVQVAVDADRAKVEALFLAALGR